MKVHSYSPSDPVAVETPIMDTLNKGHNRYNLKKMDVPYVDFPIDLTRTPLKMDWSQRVRY